MRSNEAGLLSTPTLLTGQTSEPRRRSAAGLTTAVRRGDDGKRKLLELNRQVDAHLANLVWQFNRYRRKFRIPSTPAATRRCGDTLRGPRGTAMIPNRTRLALANS